LKIQAALFAVWPVFAARCLSMLYGFTSIGERLTLQIDIKDLLIREGGLMYSSVCAFHQLRISTNASQMPTRNISDAMSGRRTCVANVKSCAAKAGFEF